MSVSALAVAYAENLRYVMARAPGEIAQRIFEAHQFAALRMPLLPLEVVIGHRAQQHHPALVEPVDDGQ